MRRPTTGMRLSLAVAAAAVLTTVAGCSNTPGTTTTPPPAPASPTLNASQQAIQKCRDAVLDQLKAPSTAKFSGEKAIPGGDGYEIVGSVDSQNSFGAMIRSTYTCNSSPTQGTHAFVSER